MSSPVSPKSGRVDPGREQKALVSGRTSWRMDPIFASDGSESTLDPRHLGQKMLDPKALRGSFDGISTGISDDFPGRRWREIPSQVTVEVGIFVPQGVRTPRFEAGRPVEWLEIPRG